VKSRPNTNLPFALVFVGLELPDPDKFDNLEFKEVVRVIR
jgi:hypothetical protein